ncbi:MAG: PLP-dependent aminotransferase family protein [Firmicutes bacterium]|nr:PLP-dependent aminotransferase family protein [Bacillota bacterium]
MKQIIIQTDNRNDQFLYEQLYETVKRDILSGSIKPGEKLPSLRSLSRDLGVSLTTVHQAYDQLMVEGYIQAKPQSGFFAEEIKSQGEQEREEGVEEIAEEELTKNEFIHDPTSFDFVKWKKCSNEVFNYFSYQLLFESDPQGEKALRNEIAKYILRSRGVKASPDRIIIGAGTQQITSHLARILLRMNISLVSIEEPGYLPVQSILKDAGLQVYHIPVMEDGIKIDRLPSNINSAVYVSPSNQFPTGAVMPIARRYELLDWAFRNKSIIIEDDYDSELRYFGRPVPALKSLDDKNCVVYLGSFSSTLFPAVKISYMVLPTDMAEIFNEIKVAYTQTCSKSEQLTLALFMEKGYYYTGIRKLRSLNARKLDLTLEAFNKYFAKDVVPMDTRSGITLTIKVRSTKGLAELILLARSIGLEMVPISAITDQATTALSFYYSQLPLEIIDSKIKELEGLWK